MTLKAVEPRRLYRQVADQIRAYLDSNALPVGARLPTEREFADRLDVSRPTVREALIALEVEGRIRIRVGSGIYVAEPAASPATGEHDGPFEVLNARALIEGAVAQAAAVNMTQEHLARLDALLARMAEVRHPSNEAIEIDRDFHVAIAAVLGNPVIEQTVLDLFNRRMSPFFGRLASYFENQESWSEALAEHRAIRDALAAHNAEGARAALHHHLARSQERFSRSFGESGPEEVRRPEMTSA